MNKATRQQQILDDIKAKGTAEVKALAAMTGVSVVTLRHDLDELASRGQILRSHGGGTYSGMSGKNAYTLSALRTVHSIPNADLKEAVAAEAVKLIAPNDSIFIGGGTTFYLMSKLLKPFKELKVVTTNVSVVHELAGYVKNIYFIGGELVEMNGIYYTGGPKIPLELEKVFVNKAFIGVSGIDLNVGLTIYDLSQLNMYQCVPNIAQKVILVCDCTKFGYQSAHKIGPVKDWIDTIITNRQVGQRFLQEFRRVGIEFITD